MQLYIADYLADTAFLDVIESGAYLHLMMNYFQTAKPLPNDDKKLARIAKCTDEQWLNIRSTVVEFFIEQENMLFHNRIENDLRLIGEKQTKQAKAGKASAEARKRKSTPSNPSNRPTVVEHPFNGCSTTVEQTSQRTLNHTDTDTDTDTDGKIDTAAQIENAVSVNQSIDHSDLLQSFTDFGFPLTYRTSAKTIAAVKDFIARGITQDQFAQVLQTAIDEKSGPGLPPWNFIAAIADSVIVGERSKSSGKSSKASGTHGGFDNRDYAGDADQSQYQIAGGAL